MIEWTTREVITITAATGEGFAYLGHHIVQVVIEDGERIASMSMSTLDGQPFDHDLLRKLKWGKIELVARTRSTLRPQATHGLNLAEIA